MSAIDWPFLLTGGLAVIIIGLSKGGFAGVGMVATPLLALVIGPITAIGVILPILLVQDVIAVAMYRRTYNKQILLTMIPGAAIGVVLAWIFASNVPAWAIELVLGIVSAVFSIYQLVQLTGTWKVRMLGEDHSDWLGVLSGVGSGFTSMIAHAGTPPFQLYVMPKRLDRDTYVGTSVIFFAATNAMKVPPFCILGLVNAQLLKTSLIFIPLAIVSSWVGIRLVRLIDVRRFNIVISFILLGVGLMLIVQGAAGLRAN